jgi:hypothetical protein
MRLEVFTTIHRHYSVGTFHMSDIRQMSVAMQLLVDIISIVTNSPMLCYATDIWV